MRHVDASAAAEIDLVGEKRRETNDEHVEGEADDELIGREAVAHLSLDHADEAAARAAEQHPDDRRVGEVKSECRAEGAGEEHALHGDVERACPFRHPLAAGGEDEHDGELERTRVDRRAGEDVAESGEQIHQRRSLTPSRSMRCASYAASRGRTALPAG